MKDSNSRQESTAAMHHARHAAAWTEEYECDLNAILRSDIGPIGAYCMGIVEVHLIQETGHLPSRWMLERAAECLTIEQGTALAESYVEDVRALERREAKRAAKRATVQSTVSPEAKPTESTEGQEP